MQRGFRARLHHAVTGALDGVGRTHLRAGRLLAVHADDGHGLDASRALHVLEMNHRLASMRVAFGARLHARLTADAAVGIDEEVEVVRFGHGASRYCCGSRTEAYAGRPVRLAHTAAAHLVLRYLADRDPAPRRSAGSRSSAGPVVRDEDRVRPDGGHDHGSQRDRRRVASRPSSSRRPRRRASPPGAGCISMRGSGYWSDERTDPAGLRSRQELADDAAGRQVDRILLAGVVDGGPILRQVESRLAIRKVERAAALGDGVVAPGSNRRGVPG